jgi:hypothetical protein
MKYEKPTSFEYLNYKTFPEQLNLFERQKKSTFWEKKKILKIKLL